MNKMTVTNNGATLLVNPQQESKIELARKEKLAQFIWTGIIVGFFVIQAIMWTVAIIVTANDKSHVIIADYENSSLSWDQTQSLKRDSEALGWQASIEVEANSRPTGERKLTLRLLNAAGQPIELPEITIEVFHWAEGSLIFPVSLKSVSAGLYEGELVMRKSGYWNFSAEIFKGDDRFFFEEKRYLKFSK